MSVSLCVILAHLRITLEYEKVKIIINNNKIFIYLFFFLMNVTKYSSSK